MDPEVLCQKMADTAGCTVRGDMLTRTLYATDASIYQQLPLGVAFPKSIEEAAAIVRAAAARGIPITARGAGSGLAGGAVGDGFIVDMARHNRTIHHFDPGTRTVRVGAGVVLDQLNAFLAPHELIFGPDVATSSRATIGGMIGNNSSGARAPIYGTTIDHTESVDVVLADGRIVTLNRHRNDLQPEWTPLDDRIVSEEALIRRRFHDGICKRWPGYGLDRYLKARPDGIDLSKIIGGSEGTLGLVFSATLSLSPIPREKGLALLFFDSVDAAFEASVALLPLKPAAIEHIDDPLFGQSKGQQQFQAARDLLKLDEYPCWSILIVEFYDQVADKLDAVARMNLGKRHLLCTDPREMGLVWGLRKAGLSLLTGRPGPAKPTAGIEDVCVPPERLPEYTAALQDAVRKQGLEVCFYGHAGSGLLHVRPVIDLHRAESIRQYRTVAETVADLTRQFNGSLAAEHGVGIARTEFIADQIGPELLGVMREIKTTLDPKNLLNPGKIFDDGRYRFDTHLRQGAGAAIPMPFPQELAYAAKDKSFIGNLEQCNGCGGCRKDAPTMCPTFQATGEELMTPRGRANIIRAVLEGRIETPQGPLLSDALEAAISNCLACRACGSECPSNVNMPLLKAELLHARYRRHGVPLAARLFSRVDRLGEAGSLFPGLANPLLDFKPLRALLRRFLGISAERSLPPYTADRFDDWFRRRPRFGNQAPRSRVILWDDCFVRYHEPQIGRAAVAVLESAGIEVILLQGKSCCGRPAFSMGRLDVAREFGRKNIALLKGSTDPILFLEPSCYTMFREDYRELGLEGAEEIAQRAILFESFIDDLIRKDAGALSFNGRPVSVAIHVHCHAKAAADPATIGRVAACAPGAAVTVLDSGCCGMAGAFGALEAKYDLSVQIAEPLIAMILALADTTDLIATGTSCRHQITHLTPKKPLHFAEWLYDRIRP